MRRSFATCMLLAAIVTVSGCAGGWRNSPPAGGGTASAPAAGAPSTGAAAGTSDRTPATADGTVFVWTGEGNSVHLAGEFNSWSTSADPLTKQPDGSWKITKKLEPGRYAYKFVIDGGTWKEDPNAAESVDDGYGGKNSLIVVGGTGTAAAPAPAAAKPAAATGTAEAPEITADGVRFTFAGGAGSVHLAGDFNSWSTTADPMTRQDDGTWTIVRKLEPGRYAYKYVVDGTTWKHDEANPETADDGYGGKNSVVVVP